MLITAQMGEDFYMEDQFQEVEVTYMDECCRVHRMAYPEFVSKQYSPEYILTVTFTTGMYCGLTRIMAYLGWDALEGFHATEDGRMTLTRKIPRRKKPPTPEPPPEVVEETVLAPTPKKRDFKRDLANLQKAMHRQANHVKSPRQSSDSSQSLKETPTAKQPEQGDALDPTSLQQTAKTGPKSTPQTSTRQAMNQRNRIKKRKKKHKTQQSTPTLTQLNVRCYIQHP